MSAAIIAQVKVRASAMPAGSMIPFEMVETTSPPASSAPALSQIAAIFPPQISHDFIQRLARALNVDSAKFIDLADDAGDLFTSSTPCALHRARGKGLVQSGDVGLIVNVAAGIQVGCALYHF